MMVKKVLGTVMAGLIMFSSFTVSPETSTAAPAGFDSYRSNIAHGKMETVQYYSKTVGVNRKTMVYTPPGYSSDKKYNVLYLLHGIGGDETEWYRSGSPQNILDNLYADQKLEPMIVVLPNGRAMKDDRPVGDIYAPDKVQAFENFEYDLLNDLIPFIQSKYSVMTSRENRAIAGLSMGGGQALNFGLGNLNTFAWVGAFSPAPNTKSPQQLIPNPRDAAQKLKALYLTCGDADGLLNVSQNTRNYLLQNNVPHTWYLGKGGHDWTIWKNGLYEFSQLLFKNPGSGLATRVEAENMTLGGTYAGKISSPFNGVALYANQDYAAYYQFFANPTHNISVRGASNNSGTARVDLLIGGKRVGSFYFTGTTPTVQTLSNITHDIGNQEIRLTLSTDNGTWDAYVDYLQITTN